MSKKLSPLEAFKRFRHNALFDNQNDYFLSTQYIDDNDIIETTFKALEIIKEKKVDIGYLFEMIEIFDEQALKQYNQSCYGNKKKLTKEEYDLLKEVLL